MFWDLLRLCGGHRAAAMRTRNRRIVLGGMAVIGLGVASACANSQPSSAPTTTPAVAPTTAVAAPTTTTPAVRAPPPAPTVTALPGTLPDPVRTPGETLPGVTAAEVCQPGWARSHRDVPETERHAAFAAYGLPYAQRGGYELDHLIPLELGGDNALANLWPEPHDRVGFRGSQTKDVIENRLHELVCEGRLDLATAQHAIAADWQTALGTSP